MKTYTVQVNVNDKGTGFDVVSPTGTTINLHLGQTKGLNLTQGMLYNKLVKKSGSYQVTADEMRILLDISKRPNVLATGLKNVQFKKAGKYVAFEKKFNDARHEQNYINQMMKNGYDYIGITDAY
ncbi:hypothetical protein MA9V1_059 [Chryseobacterium phage MA9V-1]|nr:hypothetical protein MA9V1_059 [Chryseobacterium phage MA9V-1]